jgi:hypothetical protein
MTDADRPGAGSDEEPHDRWPIGFMLLIGAVSLYLTWRLIQGIGWVVERVAG